MTSRILTPSPEHAAAILTGEAHKARNANASPGAYRSIRVMGIDPGSVSGAYAIMDTTPASLVARQLPGSVVALDDLPIVDKQINASAFRDLILTFQPDLVMLERVSAMPGQGVSSTFNFGVSVGIIRGVLAAREIVLVHVQPSKWKARFNLSRDKELSRSRAIDLYPGQSTRLARKKDHGRAEALLIAHYAKEQVAS